MTHSNKAFIMSSTRLVKNILPYAVLLFLMVQFWTFQTAAESIASYESSSSGVGAVPNNAYHYESTSQLDTPTHTDDSKTEIEDADHVGESDYEVESTANTVDSETNAKVLGAVAGIMGSSMAGGACCGCCMDQKKKGAGCCNCCCKCCDATLDWCCPCCDEKCGKKTCKSCEKNCECCDGCCIGCPECCGCDPECGCCRRCISCCPCCCKRKMRHEGPPPHMSMGGPNECGPQGYMPY